MKLLLSLVQTSISGSLDDGPERSFVGNRDRHYAASPQASSNIL